MPEVDIYAQAAQDPGESLTSGKWVKFVNLGDFIQGAYVRRTPFAPNPVYPERTDCVYVIKNKEGVWWMSIGEKEKTVHEAFNKIAPGTIVTVKYIGDKPPTQRGYKPYKIKDVSARHDLVDQDVATGHVTLPDPEAAQLQAAAMIDEPFPGAMPGAPIVQTAPPLPPTGPVMGASHVEPLPPILAPEPTVAVQTPPATMTQGADDKRLMAMSIAKVKMGEDVTPEKIMERLNIMFIDKNMSDIIQALLKM
jgi:hypothetical protein